MAWGNKLISSVDIRNGTWKTFERLFGGASKGSVAGTGVTVLEGAGKTTFTFTNVSIPTVDATTNGAQGSLNFYNFPEGLIDFRAVVSNLTITRVGTNITATAAVVASVGTATAGVDATLTGTEADLLASTTATLTAGAGAVSAVSTTAGVALFDGTGTAKKAWLNFAIPDAGSAGNDALLVNGTLTVAWNFVADK